jgi:hypothetical protein
MIPIIEGSDEDREDDEVFEDKTLEEGFAAGGVATHFMDYVAAYGSSNLLERIIKKDSNALTSPHGSMNLMKCAIAFGRVDIVQSLIKKGVVLSNGDSSNPSNPSDLGVAAVIGTSSIVNAIITETNSIDDGGNFKFPLDIRETRFKNAWSEVVKHLNPNHSHSLNVIEALLKGGKDHIKINDKVGKLRIIDRAIESGDADLVNSLIEMGAEVNKIPTSVPTYMEKILTAAKDKEITAVPPSTTGPTEVTPLMNFGKVSSTLSGKGPR